MPSKICKTYVYRRLLPFQRGYSMPKFSILALTLRIDLLPVSGGWGVALSEDS